MAKEIEFCEDLIKYLEKHGFHKLMNVPIKYNDGFNATQVQFYPKEFKNIRELKPETPFVGFEIDDETDGFVRGWLSDKGVTTKKVYYDTYDELDSFFKRITESKKSTRKSINESKNTEIKVYLDGHTTPSNKYQDYDFSPYSKKYEIVGLTEFKDDVILTFERGKAKSFTYLGVTVDFDKENNAKCDYWECEIDIDEVQEYIIKFRLSLFI